MHGLPTKTSGDSEETETETETKNYSHPAAPSKKHDLSGLVFKNPGGYTKIHFTTSQKLSSTKFLASLNSPLIILGPSGFV